MGRGERGNGGREVFDVRCMRERLKEESRIIANHMDEGATRDHAGETKVNAGRSNLPNTAGVTRTGRRTPIRTTVRTSEGKERV